jgi:hypothetical protein
MEENDVSFDDYFKELKKEDELKHKLIFSYEAQLDQALRNCQVEDEYHDELFNFIVNSLKLVIGNKKMQEDILKIEERKEFDEEDKTET